MPETAPQKLQTLLYELSTHTGRTPRPRASNRFGNSVRGTEVWHRPGSRLGLHVFDCVNVGSSFLDAIL